MDLAAFYIILTGMLVAISTSLLGSFLVLRRMAMLGDAISHAVLPGIVLGFLWSGSRNPWVMFIGALALGLINAYVIEVLHKHTRIQKEASIGVSFTSFFALGVLLISFYASSVDLDQECVLYGEIAYVPLDIIITADGRSLGPRSLYIMGAAALAVLAFVFSCYYKLSLISFDPLYASSIGVRLNRWHYGLMSAVSFVVVCSFEVVGAILVVAFLVVPPAAAYLLSKRLPFLLILSCLLGCVAVVGGYALATWLDGSIAGAMAICNGIIFSLCLLFYRLQKTSLLSKQKRGPASFT